MKVILCPNPYRDIGLKAALETAEILREKGATPVFCFPFMAQKNVFEALPEGIEIRNMKNELEDADFLISFGGDGTILHAAKDSAKLGVPIVGVNMGSVGFMAELEYPELRKVEKLITGDYVIENRMMLDIRVIRNGKILFTSSALNDAVVTKGAVARVVDLGIYSGDNQIARVFGDGVILATPTGSTAYSLSAGGPIVEPTANNLLVTPISSHSLSAKAMVLSGESILKVVVTKESKKIAYLSVDGGKAFKLLPGDTVQAMRSRHSLKIVKLAQKNFYELVNNKLGRR